MWCVQFTFMQSVPEYLPHRVMPNSLAPAVSEQQKKPRKIRGFGRKIDNEPRQRNTLNRNDILQDT